MAFPPPPVRASWFAAASKPPYLAHNATKGDPSRLSWVRDEPAFCVVAARNQLGTNLRRSGSGAAACCRRGGGRACRGPGVVGVVVFLGDVGPAQRLVAGCVGGGDDGRRDPVCGLAQRGGRPGGG